MRVVPVLFATIGALLVVPASAQDKATIQSVNDRFAEAFNKDDAAAVAALYTEDAILLPPGAEMVQGRGGIQAFWKGAAAQIGEMRLTTVDLKPLGSDAAREVGTFTARTKGQPSQEVVGKYVVVWQKVGSDWKLATDIWNTNK